MLLTALRMHTVPADCDVSNQMPVACTRVSHVNDSIVNESKGYT